ncbi:MAG: hypothetical protein LUG94_08470 [Ruminococcus sp.]|nr:hypothetical protein [Ruminococcus sp.]
MTKKDVKKIIFNIGTVLEIVTAFLYAIFRKDIIIFIGFPIAVILMLLGKYHRKTAQEKKLEQIELHDERNILIRDKAQSKTNLIMVYLCLATIIILALMGYFNASVFVSIAVIIDSVMARYLTYYYDKRL